MTTKKTDEKIIEDIFFQFPIGNADFSDAIEETIKQKNKQFQKKIDDIIKIVQKSKRSYCILKGVKASYWHNTIIRQIKKKILKGD